MAISLIAAQSTGVMEEEDGFLSKVGAALVMGFVSPFLLKGMGKAWGAVSTGVGRVATGAVVGAGISYAQAGDNPNHTFESVMKGAALGAVGGFVVGQIPGQAWRAAKSAIGSGRGKLGATAWSATKAAGRVGRFAFEHPVMTAGMIGGAMYIAGDGGNMQSPTLTGGKVDTQYDQQRAAIAEMSGGTGQIGGGPVGNAPMMMGRYQRALQNSTQGLVQGLHRGRH